MARSVRKAKIRTSTAFHTNCALWMILFSTASAFGQNHKTCPTKFEELNRINIRAGATEPAASLHDLNPDSHDFPVKNGVNSSHLSHQRDLHTASNSNFLIQKIKNLKHLEEIPEDVFQNYEVNEIAKAIVTRVREQEIEQHPELIKRSDQKLVNLRSNSKIMLFFDGYNAQKIAKNGFLNQHQAHSSKGNYHPSLRKWIEDVFTGLKLGTSAQSLRLRPKSAFLNITEDVRLGQRVERVDQQYGGAIAVMKESIKDRSLWIADDSVGLTLLKDKSLPSLFTSEGLLNYRGTFDSNRISTSDIIRRYYYEAQIYGDLTFEDVDYFLVTDMADVNKLKSLGKPIYLMKVSEKHGRLIYELDKLLHKQN